MKTVAKVLAVIGVLVVVGVLVLGVLGFIAYRNLFPSMDKAEAAETVGKFKLRKAFPVKGNILGTETSYFLEYETNSSSKKNALTYALRKFWSESGAVEDFQKAECSQSDLAKEGAIKDKNGNTVGDFKYCGGTLHFRNKSRSATIYTFVIGNSDYAPDSVVVDFIKSLAINSDLDFSSFAPAYPSLLTESKKDANPTTSSDSSQQLFEIVRKEKKSGVTESQHNGEEFTVRGYIYSATSITTSDGKGMILIYDREDISNADSVYVSCSYDKKAQTGFTKLKGKQFITVKGVFDSQLKNCQLVSVE